MSRQMNPVRRCAKCDEDWPNTNTYNLCPICQRNTYASTSETRPDPAHAAQARVKYDAIRSFDEACDLAFEMDLALWAAEMDALLEQTTSPAPPATTPTNHGLAGKSRLQPPTSPQDVRYPWQAGGEDAQS